MRRRLGLFVWLIATTHCSGLILFNRSVFRSPQPIVGSVLLSDSSKEMNDENKSAIQQCSNDAVSFGFLVSIIIRSSSWIALLILVPFLLLPRCLRMFEEFGTAIPMPTQWTLSVGDIILKFGFGYVIVAIPAIVVWQLILFFVNERRIGSKLVAVDWILISVAALFLAVSLGMPITAILSGMNG